MNPDESTALKWYTAAAQQGFALALCNLGFYEYKKGERRNLLDAMRYFFKAEKGSTVAQLNLGFIYANGLMGAVDNREARKWYQKAADSGNEKAANILKSLK